MSQIGEPQRVHEIEPAVEPWVVTMPPEEIPVPVEQPTVPEFEEEPT